VVIVVVGFPDGADLREIGDLLGHQDMMTTSLYTDVTVSDLRALVQPWPIT
jgi:site-specific recombinase XerD